MNPSRSAYPAQRGEEFPGIVRMIRVSDFHRRMGKICLDDGRESCMMCFPANYEDGDRIFAVFPGGNPEQPPITFRVANEEWNYGTVVRLGPDGNGSILVSWPILRGLVFLNGRDFQAIDRMAVRFRLRKNERGDLSVADLSEAPRDMVHYATMPSCGRLVRGLPLWKSGVVKNVLNRETGWFGFIEQLGVAKGVFFGGRLFERVYGRKAMRGDVVHFQVTEGERGPAVNAFNPSGDDENNSTWVMETQTPPGPFQRVRLIRCPENTFSGFLEPSPDKLYFVYATSRDVAVVTREVRIERVPEAIEIVKSGNIPEVMKLDAVDFLIKADVEHPRQFQASYMRERRVEMLENIAADLLNSGRAEEALEYEIRLQCIEFRPERLQAYAHRSSSPLLPEPAEVLLPLDEERIWEVLQTDPLPLLEDQDSDAWRPIFEPPSDDASRIAPEHWSLDPDWEPDKAFDATRDQLYFDIELA